MALRKDEVSRYGRQLILPEWGVRGQEKAKATSVVIVGAGGLGCPAAQYLAAAGIGHLGIVDYDEVELSNLHRQVLHSEARVGVSKPESMKHSLQSLNSSVKYTAHHVLLNSSNALEILREYDVVVDATDNVASRYLLNDACVLLGKPLVSGSALRFEGQLTVYHHHGSPCYRCLFPSPPPPHTVTNCSEGGVLGVIPGVIGSLQALEVLKIATEIGETYAGRLLVFDGMAGSFQVIRLRSRESGCAVCGDNPTITRLIDYEQFCGSKANDKERRLQLLSSKDRISVNDYHALSEQGGKHVLLDVRETVEYDIYIPLKQLQCSESALLRVNDLTKQVAAEHSTPVVRVYVVCRRGNDSQVAVQLLREHLPAKVSVKDIEGGLLAWSESVDPNFPVY